MEEGAEEWGECVQKGRHQAALFYAGNGMVALSDPAGYRVHLTPWLACLIYRVNLTPWSACLIGWICGPMLGIQLALSAAPDSWRRIRLRQRMGDR